MSDECYGDRGQSSVLTLQRKYPATNGHLDHLKDTSNSRNELESLEKSWVDSYHHIGFSNGIKRKLDLMPSSSSSSSTSSGIKKQSHHHHHHHHHHQSKHHQKTSNNHHKRSGHGKKSEQKRFCRTAAALKQAGLLELTLETAQLVQENDQLQKELDLLQEQTIQFSKALQEQLEEKLKKANNGI